MMIEAEFYEIAAADVCGINTDRLWSKTREEEVVLARSFCVMYRKDVLGLNPKVSALRYFMNRATYYSAKKKISDSKDTNHVDYVLWKKFMNKCTSEASGINASLPSIVSAKKSLANVGWGTYCESKKRFFMKFFNDLRSGDDEESLRKRLPELNTVVQEIGWLLQNE